jgi:uncharacterized membrane protein
MDKLTNTMLLLLEVISANIYGRHHKLFDRYETFICPMTMERFPST